MSTIEQDVARSRHDSTLFAETAIQKMMIRILFGKKKTSNDLLNVFLVCTVTANELTKDFENENVVMFYQQGRERFLQTILPFWIYFLQRLGMSELLAVLLFVLQEGRIDLNTSPTVKRNPFFMLNFRCF